MKFSDYQTEDLRLAILLLLTEANEYTINEFLLQQVLVENGHSVGQDKLRNELTWLQEQSLLELKNTASLYVATLNTRGLDVAKGRSKCPGVKKPMPT